MFALVDCNNFYVSCQRLFRPDLENKPIVVLSNNDGCIVSRSNEAKALGIPMGAPEFKWRGFLKENHVHVFSSNYSLYGDLSARVMRTLSRFTTDLEIYSIDEAFLDLKGFEHRGVEQYTLEMREKTTRWTGIPVSIGVAPTKTLAKIATHVAKKKSNSQGVYLLHSEKQIDYILKRIPISDVWGVGRRLSKQLQYNRIHSAYDLKMANSQWIKRNWSVVLQRTALELNGERCLELEAAVDRQQIMVSRSFKKRITYFDKLRSLIAGYTARAAEKLRQQNSLTDSVMAYIQTSPHSNEAYYHPSQVIHLPCPTADTSMLIKATTYALKMIYKPKQRYMKAGVLLVNVMPEKNQQLSLFSANTYNSKRKTCMQTLDKINYGFGPQSLRMASESPERWYMHQKLLSPCYTTKWADLPTVK